MPTDIKGLSLWWILRLTFFCRDNPENQSNFFPAKLLLFKTMMFKNHWIMLTVFIVQKLVPDSDNFVIFCFDIVPRLYPLSQ